MTGLYVLIIGALLLAISCDLSGIGKKLTRIAVALEKLNEESPE